MSSHHCTTMGSNALPEVIKALSLSQSLSPKLNTQAICCFFVLGKSLTLNFPFFWPSFVTFLPLKALVLWVWQLCSFQRNLANSF